MILKESIIQDERDTNPLKVMVKGYIQSISADPFYVTLFNEASVRLYHSICNNSVVHIDATGTIVCNTNSPTQLLYYALIVPQPNKGQAPIAVAEFISLSHSMLTISHFLNTFLYGETKLFGGTTCQPKYVIMDGSSAIFGSVLSS